MISVCVFQFEGAVNEGNKGANIWDTFASRTGTNLKHRNFIELSEGLIHNLSST